ncbi:MAG: sulfotransferase domain-containing protein [Pseudomonadota bacterium]|jgi:aryl sulfotransferase
MATQLASRAPVKTREIHNHHIDSTIWNDFAFRDDDIVIATYAKSGTTWAQQIVGQLLFDGDPDLDIAELSPWLDLRVPPREVTLRQVEAQTHRRFLKTHLPVDALLFDHKARYIYVARDGRDVVWSLHNHHANATPAWYAAINDSPGRIGPPVPQADPDVARYFRTWLDKDGDPFWPFWHHVRSWWAIKDQPNVLLLHFEDLKRDLPGEMKRIADFLEIRIDPARFPAMVGHCGFDWMKANATRVAPLGGAFWNGGAQTFINKGINGRWRDMLSPRDVADYETRSTEELGPICARWLAGGVRAV